MEMPRSFSCRRLRCSPVYLKQSGDHGSKYQDRGLCPGASGHVPHNQGTTILLRRSAHLSVTPLAPCSRRIPTLVQRHDSSSDRRHTPVCRTPLCACLLLTTSPASSCADRQGTSHAVKVCAELSQPSKLRLQQCDIMVTRRLRAKPTRGPAIAWITIEGIRPNTLTDLTVFKDSQDVLNARNEEDQRRLCAPLIEASLDGLVHMPEHIRAHMVI